MGTNSRSSSMNTRRAGSGGPPPRGFGGPDSGELGGSLPTTGAMSAHPGTSWRSWLVFMLTIGVLVTATAVFVNYIAKVPPGISGDVEQAKADAAAAREEAGALLRKHEALGSEVETLAPVARTVPELERELAAAQAELGGLRGKLDAYQAKIERLEGELTSLPAGDDASDLRATVAQMKETVGDLQRRVRSMEGLDSRVASLERVTQAFDLPGGVTLTTYVGSQVDAHDKRLRTEIGRVRRDAGAEVEAVERYLERFEGATAALPRGTILIWHSSGSLPAGWVECDGRNGTPDLRNRFPYGASNPSYVGHKGGGGGGGGAQADHWHHADTWTNTEWRGKPALIFVQGVPHPGKNVYALFGEHGHASGGAAMPAYTAVRFIMKR